MTPVARGIWFNWALIIVALGLSVAVFTTRHSVTSGERMSRSRHLLTSFQSDQVLRVMFTQGNRRWVVERAEKGAPSRFALLEPLQGDAEEATIDQLLRAAQFATWVRKLDGKEVDRAALGLDDPGSVLSLDLGTFNYRIRIGNEAPTPQGARYVELSGEGAPNKGVYVLSQTTAEDLSPDPEDFRIRQMIPYAGAKLEQLTAQQGNQRLVLKRHGRNGFRFGNYASGARLSEESVDRMNIAFSRTRAQRFVDMDRAVSIQQATEAVLTLELVPRGEDAEPAKLTIGGACPEADELVLAVRHSPRPSAGCIADRALPEMFSEPEWLVDRKLFVTTMDAVERLSIRAGEKELLLRREGDGFSMQSPRTGNVEKEAAEQRLTAMLGTRGQFVKDTSNVAVDWSAPSLVARIDVATSDETGDSRVVEFAQGLEGAWWARRKDDGALLSVAENALGSFQPDALLLKSTQLTDFDRSQVRTVFVEYLRGKHAPSRFQLAQPERGVFELLAPADYQADNSIAVRWVEVASQLVAERWVAEQANPAHGLEPPRMTLRVETADGKSTLIEVGERTAGGAFGRVDGGPEVCIVGKKPLRELNTLPIARSGFSFDPATLQQLTLRSPEAHIELRRLGSELVQTGGAPELSPAATEALVDALSLLRPDAAVAFGADAGAHRFDQPSLEVLLKLRRSGEMVEMGYVLGVADVYEDVAVFLAKKRDSQVVYALPRSLVERVREQL